LIPPETLDIKIIDFLQNQSEMNFAIRMNAKPLPQFNALFYMDFIKHKKLGVKYSDNLWPINSHSYPVKVYILRETAFQNAHHRY